jgi:large subunit ribosomal protein L13
MKKSNNDKKTIERSWYLCDLNKKVLGRASSRIASILQGKHLTNFSRNLDCGDNVIIINADKFILTGSKAETKIYYKHTGYIGNLKKKTLKDKLSTSPRDIVKKSVMGMLPKNLLRDNMIKRLHIYSGEEHPHKNINIIKSL